MKMIIIEEKEDGPPGRILSSVAEFKDNSLQVAKKEDRRIASQLDNLLSDTSLKGNIFKRYIKTLADCEDVNTRGTKELLEDSGFWRLLVRSGIGWNVICGTI